MKVKLKSLSHHQLFASPMDCSFSRLLQPWAFSGKNTGVSCHFFFQGIFLTQGSNPSLLPSRQTTYHLSHQQISYIYIFKLQPISNGINKKFSFCSYYFLWLHFSM